FTRNRIRNELLPLLREQFNPEVDVAVTRLSRVSADAQMAIEQLANELLERCRFRQDARGGESIALDVVKLRECDRHVVREMFVILWRQMDWPLQAVGFEECDLLASMSDPQDLNAPRKRGFPGGVMVERIGNELRLRRGG